jgi:hypothetical protein
MSPLAAQPGDRPPVIPHLLIWGLAIGQLVGWGTLYYSLAVMIGPMEQELGWSKVELNAGLTFGLGAACVAAIPVGTLIDRYGGYWFMVLGAMAGAVLLLIWSVTSTLWIFYAVWFGIGIVQACTLAESAYNIIISNLDNHRRGITLITLLSGLSSSVAIPFITFCVDSVGWRPALMVLAVLQFLIPGLVSAWVLRGIGTAQQKQAASADSIAFVRRPLRLIALDPIFWALAAAFSVHTFVGNGVTFHVIPLLQERGYAMSLIIAMLAMHGPSQVAARMLLLLIGTRISTAGYGRIAFAMMAVGVALLGLSGWLGAIGLFVYALVYGMGTGLLTLVRANSVIEYLSAYGYGAASGGLVIAMAIPRTMSAVIFALLWQASGDYDAVLWMALLLCIGGLASFWLATVWNSRRPPIQGL